MTSYQLFFWILKSCAFRRRKSEFRFGGEVKQPDSQVVRRLESTFDPAPSMRRYYEKEEHNEKGNFQDCSCRNPVSFHAAGHIGLQLRR